MDFDHSVGFGRLFFGLGFFALALDLVVALTPPSVFPVLVHLLFIRRGLVLDGQRIIFQVQKLEQANPLAAID